MTETTRHPATTQLLRWFEYDHLPPNLQDTSRAFHFLGHRLVESIPDGPADRR